MKQHDARGVMSDNPRVKAEITKPPKKTIRSIPLTQHWAFCGNRNANRLSMMHEVGVNTREDLRKALAGFFAEVGINRHAQVSRLARLLEKNSFIRLPTGYGETLFAIDIMIVERLNRSRQARRGWVSAQYPSI